MPTNRPIQTQNTLGEILECYSDIEELKDEMEEWRDNTPESLQGSDKYASVEEAADTLDRAHQSLESDCSAIMGLLGKIPKDSNEMSVLDMPVKYTERKMYKGYQMPRWVRLANPCAALEAAMEHIDRLMSSIKAGLNEEDGDSLKQSVEEVNSALGDLQSVEFPSMFG